MYTCYIPRAAPPLLHIRQYRRRTLVLDLHRNLRYYSRNYCSTVLIVGDSRAALNDLIAVVVVAVGNCTNLSLVEKWQEVYEVSMFDYDVV